MEHSEKQDKEMAKKFYDAANSEEIAKKLLTVTEGFDTAQKIDDAYYACIKNIRESFASSLKEFKDKTGLRIYSIEIQGKKILVDVNNEAFWNEIHMLLRFHLESTWKK